MIGIFGGTFDPVHYGHLRSALEVKEVFGLAEVRMIPSANPPHRNEPAATAQMRVDMLKLAIANQPGFICDTRELDREGRSYMVDTLRSLHADLPDRTLMLFIGCDAFHSLMTWHQWQQLFDYAHIVVMTRPGFETQELDDFFKTRHTILIKDLTQSPAGKLFFQPVTPLAISSTAIRSMIAAKQTPEFLLPDAVLDYIKQNRLYGQP